MSSWKTPPPAPPGSGFCTCENPVSLSGGYCANCGKKLRPGSRPPPPPPPAMVKPIVKPAVVQVARPIPTATKPMHPLEQRFMERMMGQKPTPLKPAGDFACPKPLVHPMTPAYGTPPKTTITPPSAFPTFKPSAAKPIQKPMKSATASRQAGIPTLDFSAEEAA